MHRDVMRCVQNVLREEVKEKMIWSVDRSSPSNKIRDLMKWSKDILKDIFYQRKILSSPIATFFTKQWSMLCPCYCLCQSCNAQVLLPRSSPSSGQCCVLATVSVSFVMLKSVLVCCMRVRTVTCCGTPARSGSQLQQRERECILLWDY